jgi:DNA-binding IclR family transcriptional regulator
MGRCLIPRWAVDGAGATNGYAAPVQRSAAGAPRPPHLTGALHADAGDSLAELLPDSEVGGADNGTGYQRIQAVDRAVVLLKAVANSTTPPTVLELAQATGINRSTAWRLLRTLEYHGLLDRDAITQRYTMGYGAIAIAAAVTDDALVRRARPLLEDLAMQFGESVTLAVAKRFNLVYVDQVDPPDAIVPSWLNKPLPLHATSGGKVFLAWLRADERAAILPKELQRYTDRTITDREDLGRELDAARRVGYALCVREYEEFSSGVSAAVLNSRQYPIAVVNVWGPAQRNPARRLHEIGRQTAATAESVRTLIA